MLNNIEHILKKNDIEKINIDDTYWSSVVPLIFKIQREGASFFIKIDGDRSTNIFTLMIEGGFLKNDYIRCETDSLQEGVNKIVSEYAQRFWI